MHERSHNELHFSMRVFKVNLVFIFSLFRTWGGGSFFGPFLEPVLTKLRQQYDNADVYLMCTLNAK